MTMAADAEKLATYARKVLGDGPFERVRGWDHIGAVICDACLQGGMTYETQIRPAVERLIASWPDASTLSGFQRRLGDSDIAAQLGNSNAAKMRAISELTALLADEGVETIEDLRGWLAQPGNVQKLHSVHNIASKTSNYIQSLAGISAVAVDVHLKNFARDAGVSSNLSHEELRQVYLAAAEALGEDPGGLDHAAWKYQRDL